jgi:fructose-1,6-bisphosphatase/sedoheptulose 1,7-bisphosphatase-like protein
MQGRLAPQSAAELARLDAADDWFGQQRPEVILGLDDLVADGNCVLVVTAVTGGSLLAGPRCGPTGLRIASLMSTPDQPCLFVNSDVPLLGGQ